MVEIFSMSINDVDAVTELEKECFYTAWTREDFEKEMTQNDLAIYFVAKEDEKIVGYAGMWHVLDEGHITNVAVSPDRRRCGIGSKLICELISVAEKEKMRGLTLEVRFSNLPAQKLYTRYGFKIEGIRKKYYSDTKEDAIIMWKYFDTSGE